MPVSRFSNRIWAMCVAFSVGVTSFVAIPAPVAACDNFVGGVCLDKKKPAKKKVRKKTVKKKKLKLEEQASIGQK